MPSDFPSFVRNKNRGYVEKIICVSTLVPGDILKCPKKQMYSNIYIFGLSFGVT